jgi:hypothetical protein
MINISGTFQELAESLAACNDINEGIRQLSNDGLFNVAITKLEDVFVFMESGHPAATDDNFLSNLVCVLLCGTSNGRRMLRHLIKFLTVKGIKFEFNRRLRSDAYDGMNKYDFNLWIKDHFMDIQKNPDDQHFQLMTRAKTFLSALDGDPVEMSLQLMEQLSSDIERNILRPEMQHRIECRVVFGTSKYNEMVQDVFIADPKNFCDLIEFFAEDVKIYLEPTQDIFQEEQNKECIRNLLKFVRCMYRRRPMKIILAKYAFEYLTDDDIRWLLCVDDTRFNKLGMNSFVDQNIDHRIWKIVKSMEPI